MILQEPESARDWNRYALSFNYLYTLCVKIVSQKKERAGKCADFIAFSLSCYQHKSITFLIIDINLIFQTSFR